jgi:phospholipid transport system transporter-binding protein
MRGAWIVPRGRSRFGVEGVLDFDTVGPLAAEARPLFSGKERLEIDLQGVRSANSAGLALLLEWLELAHRGGVSLRFRNLPESLSGLASVTNVTGLLPVVKSGG